MDQINTGGGAIMLIHFVSEVMVPPVEEEGPPVPQWRIACMPNMTEFGETMYHPPHHRSDDARAVTCPACKNTHEYARMMERLNAAAKR